MLPLRSVLSLAVLLAGCRTAYQWGASEDPEWSGRTGTARLADVMSALGQPRETLRLENGESKARWLARSMTIASQPGVMRDYSIESEEARPIWRDMLFSSDGVLLRAWTSDQRRLADSEPP